MKPLDHAVKMEMTEWSDWRYESWLPIGEPEKIGTRWVPFITNGFGQVTQYQEIPEYKILERRMKWRERIDEEGTKIGERDFEYRIRFI